MKLFLWFGDFVYGKFLDGINKMKKVSVIIVSYNVRSYLAHAIDSILKSNYKKYEIIVVDNHSYDGTCDYLKENYQYIKQLHVISNSDSVGALRYLYSFHLNNHMCHHMNGYQPQ